MYHPGGLLANFELLCAPSVKHLRIVTYGGCHFLLVLYARLLGEHSKKEMTKFAGTVVKSAVGLDKFKAIPAEEGNALRNVKNWPAGGDEKDDFNAHLFHDSDVVRSIEKVTK